MKHLIALPSLILEFWVMVTSATAARQVSAGLIPGCAAAVELGADIEVKPMLPSELIFVTLIR